jgi:parkin
MNNRQLQIVILIKGADNKRIRRSLIVDTSEQDNVSSIKSKISKAAGLPLQDLNLIFGGRKLPTELPINTLLLGESTCLFATVTPDNDGTSSENTTVISARDVNNGSYFVYCKNCNCLHQGKMRISCTGCKSNAVLLKNEPNDWSDVFDGDTLIADCQICEEERPVNIQFKCTKCDDVSSALRHVKRNRYMRDCIICGETDTLIVVLDCQHSACLGCFICYMDTCLENWHFVRKPSTGYTIMCAMPECSNFVEDVHHFHLLGIDKYRNYQRISTEKFVNLQDERQYCPYPNCGAAFMVEMFENENTISCPECLRLYCCQCRSTEKCQCNEQPDESTVFIKTISKNCPTCGVATERNGGCSHIVCTQCRNDWCFICVKPWSSECQWDHWFD